MFVPDDKNSLDELDISNINPYRLEEKTKTVLNPKEQRRLRKKRVAQLFANGLTTYEIHKETGFELKECRSLTKEIQKDINEFDKYTFFQLLKGKIIQILDNHSMISVELVKQFHRALESKSNKDIITVAREIGRNNKDLSSILSSMGVSAPANVDNLNTSPNPSTNNKIQEIEFEDSEATDLDSIRDEMREATKRLNQYMDDIDKLEKSN